LIKPRLIADQKPQEDSPTVATKEETIALKKAQDDLEI
jgi:hypothetical protein